MPIAIGHDAGDGAYDDHGNEADDSCTLKQPIPPPLWVVLVRLMKIPPLKRVQSQSQPTLPKTYHVGKV
jgi:hypothetical protein